MLVPVTTQEGGGLVPVYATAADITDYGVPPNVTIPGPPEVDRRLRRASERVDDALLVAVYDVDETGMPTAATVIEALRDATCAQVIHWSTHEGSEDGTADQWDNVSIGSVRLGGRTKSTSTQAGGTEGLVPEALAHLRRAGLLGGGPIAPGIRIG